jgi:YD repeat-containing protein
LAQTDERNHATSYEYDPGCACSGRVTKVTDALTHSSQTTFDAAGRRASHIDEKGRVTRFVTDARGRTVRTLYPDNTQMSATYDLATGC